MIINKVTVFGLRKLYEYFADIYSSPSKVEYRDKGQKDQMLRHMKIYLYLDEISPMEYFILTRYVGNRIHPLSSYKRILSEDSVGATLTKYNGLMEQIHMDQDYSFSDEELEDMLGFPGQTSIPCIIEFTGIQLLNLFQVDSFLSLLRNWLKSSIIKLPRDGGGLPVYQFPSSEDIFDRKMSIHYPKESFEDFTIKTFIENFYKFYADLFSDDDIVTYAFTHNRIYSGIKYGQNILTEITSPITSIDVRDPRDMENFSKKIQEMKSTIQSSGAVTMDLQNDVSFTMSAHQPLSVLLKLAMVVSPEMIIDFSDLKVILGSTDTGLMIAEKLPAYKARIIQYFSYLRTHREKLIKQQKSHLLAMDFIPNMTPICFSISGSLKEFHELISKVKNSKSLLLSTKDITYFTTIENCIKMIENSFN